MMRGLFLLYGLLGLLPLAEAAPIRVREIYVPYEEFRARTGNTSNGIVMQLDEYRALVLKAIEKSREKPSPELPPLESTLTSAHYKGVLEGNSARFTAILKVRVPRDARDGWVRCDLGKPLPQLGSILVNDKPGWLLVEDESRATLLLRGKGEHEVQLTFTLAAVENDDIWRIAGPLVSAATSRLELDVPGRVEAHAQPDFLETVPLETVPLETADGGGSSRLILAAGGASDFKIEWRRKKAFRENEALLAADHAVTYVPRRDNPVFVWDAYVKVDRQRVDSLIFTEARGTTVVKVEGPHLQYWERVDAGLRVVLSEPTLGKVRLRFQGVVDAPEATDGNPPVSTFVFGPPALLSAYSNTGYLALYEPRESKLLLESTDGADEVGLREVTLGLPPHPDRRGGTREAGGGAPGAAQPARIYSFASPAARLNVRLSDVRTLHESRSTYLVRFNNSGAALTGALRVAAREGRVYRLSLSLPAPWRLLDLTEADLTEAGADAQAGHGLRYKVVGSEENRAIELELQRAIEPAQPLDLRIRLEHDAYADDRRRERRAVEIQLPVLAGAQRARTDLGIAIPGSMDALMRDLPGWRSLSQQEATQLGLEAAVAILTTDEPEARVSLTLVRRPARGEYRQVLHVLALERQLRVRADLQLALVDRPFDEIVFRLPPSAGESTVILGDGIKEVTTDTDSGARTVRFSSPWLGTRQFRIEYETPHEANTSIPIPVVEVEPGAARGSFGSEQFLVLESHGPVEIVTSIGPGLAPMDMDDLPDFAEPWKNGRVLAAYRFRPTGDPGTLSTEVHERAPVLASLAREMNLTTILGPGGVSRTTAEILLAYTRQQYIRVALPADARPIAVSVNDEPIRSVRPEAGGARKDGVQELSIPLPPQSYARIQMIYERLGGRVGRSGETVRLAGSWGSWREEAPHLPDIPVGETTWTFYHPDGYRFLLAGGNLRADSARNEERGGTFAGTFLGKILSGKPFCFSALLDEHPTSALATIPGLTPEERMAAAPQPARGPTTHILRQTRAPAGAGVGSLLRQANAAPRFQLLPEGRNIRATKIGGRAALDLNYRSVAWSDFARRSVFLGALLAGWILGLRRGRRAFFRFVFLGFAGATLTPVAFGWSSPLLAVPLSEALFLLAVAGGVYCLLSLVRRRVRGRVALRGTAAVALIVSLATVGRAVRGDEGAAQEPPPVPADGILIPYDATQPVDAGGGNEKVFLPHEVFRDLWKLANPQEPEEKALPEALVLGNAEYHLRLERRDAYRISGVVQVHVLTDRWVVFPLPLERAQIARVLVDGVDAGIAQGHFSGSKTAVPFIELKGRGRKRIEIELVGAVEEELGEFKISAGLIQGAALSLRAELPEGARVEAGHAAVVRSEQNGTIVVVDLGKANRLDLKWSFPKKEGQTGSQIDSRSFSKLVLTSDGYRVSRLERVRVTGRPVDRVEYRIHGNWRINKLTGTDVSEWTVSPDLAAPGTETLQVFFAKPISQTDLHIAGYTLMEDSGPLACLSLAGAVKQETLVGLYHTGNRRFRQDVLGGMRRASKRDLSRLLPGGREESPDRIYQAYGSGEGESVSAETLTGEVSISTEIIAVVAEDRLITSARSRYAVKGPGPLRHEVAIPAGWSVRTVSSNTLRDWEVTDVDGTRRLRVHFTGRAVAGTQVTWTADHTGEVLPDPLEWRGLRALPSRGVELRETQQWLIAANDAIDLHVIEAARLVPTRLEAAPKWVALPSDASYRFAFHTPRGDASERDPVLRLGTVPRPSQLSATVISFARIAEDRVHVNARVIHRVRLGARDRFHLVLPEGALLESIETRNQRSRDVREAAGGTEIEIILQSPVTGEVAVDVSYKLPASETAPRILPVKVLDGESRLEEVDQYVGVVQTATHFISPGEVEGLIAVEPGRLPFLPQGVAVASLKPTFRSTRLDWSLALDEEAIEVAPGPAAVIELVEIWTFVGNDGTARTRAVYTVRNRSLQFLMVEVPAGTDLWGVTLNGKPVAVGTSAAATPGAAARTLRIPVEHVGAASLNLEVALHYAERPLDLPSARGSAALTAPKVVGTQVVETVWNLYFPDGYSVSRGGGNMREAVASVQYAKKVGNLLEQLEKITKTASESDSRRVREQAANEMARLEQALGDNLAELEVTNRGAADRIQSGKIAQVDLEEQWGANDIIIRRSQRAQSGLRQAREHQEKQRELEKAQKAPQAPLSKKEQSFLDSTNYLKGSWLDNNLPVRRGGAKIGQHRREERSGEKSLESLLEQTPYNGLEGAQVAGGAPDADLAEPAAVDGSAGLKPLPHWARTGAAPGLETPAKVPTALPYTFVHQGGDARLTVSFTRRDMPPRLGAILALVALVGVVAWRLRAGR